MIPDPFNLILAAIAGAILYAVVVHLLPGRQPGEDKLDAFLERFGVHADRIATSAAVTAGAVQRIVEAPAPAVAAPPPPAAPAAAPLPRDLPPMPGESILAYVERSKPPVAAAPAPSAPTTPQPEQTLVQWIVANHPEALSTIGALLAFAATLPGSLTFADIWLAWTARRPAPAPDVPALLHGSVDPYRLTPENWSYVQRHNLLACADSIFAGNTEDVARAMGSNAGTIATAKPEPMIPGSDGVTLAAWI
jgi:hypothetical protein